MFLPVAGSRLGRTPTGPPRCRCWPRGLYLLHARYGKLPFESLIVPAEQLARFGTPASRALVRDIGTGRGPLLADPQARAVFSREWRAAGRGPAAGADRPRRDAVADSRRGRGRSLYRRAGAADRAGLAAGRRPDHVGRHERRAAHTGAPIVLSERHDKVAFLPPPADGGLAAAAAFAVLQHAPSALSAAAARALAAAERWRAGGVDADTVLHTPGSSGAVDAAASRFHQLRHA